MHLPLLRARCTRVPPFLEPMSRFALRSETRSDNSESARGAVCSVELLSLCAVEVGPGKNVPLRVCLWSTRASLSLLTASRRRRHRCCRTLRATAVFFEAQMRLGLYPPGTGGCSAKRPPAVAARAMAEGEGCGTMGQLEKRASGRLCGCCAYPQTALAINGLRFWRL